jgi:Calx-beta domain
VKRRLINSILLVALVAGVAVVPTPAAASEHLMYIDEVFGGVGYATDIDFIELRMYSGGQTDVAGTSVTIFDNSGAEIDEEQITNDSGITNGASGASILMATEAAEDHFDMAADFARNISLPPSGRACFGPSDTSFYDCVSWGNYTGASPQTPANNPEGMVQGASFRRTYGSNGIDGGDDHNDNQRDFIINTPDPRNNNGDTFDADQRIKFASSADTVPENIGSPFAVPAHRLGDTTGAVDFLFSMTNGTAEGSDYTDASGIKTFADGISGIDILVTVDDNSTFEGPETINMTMRGPTSPAFLASPVNSRLTITDFEDDEDPPSSEITKPEHDQSYKPSRLGKLRGTSDDGVGVVDVVKAALRQTRTDGSCKWFNGNRFVNGACGDKKLINSETEQNGDWSLALGDPLKKSVGTNVRFYTVYSKAKDSANPAANVESGFEKGRNSNKFEIK